MINNHLKQKSVKKKTLVKRYINLEELTEDNNSPVFVDKNDETPYDIGEEWKRNNSILVASADDDELVVALKQFLMENNSVQDKAEIDARAMVYGSRKFRKANTHFLIYKAILNIMLDKIMFGDMINLYQD